MAGIGIAAKSDPVAGEIMNRLSRLANLAGDTAGRASAQLGPICQEDRPCDEKVVCGEVEREYPPLFCEMRSAMNTIENSLRRMNNILDRCEV